MDLAIVTDELRVPQCDAFPLVREWQITRIELRGLTGGRIPDGDTEEALRLVKEHAMVVTSISPGVFKCKPEEREINEDLERLKRAVSLCPRFDCRQIIIFTVQNPDRAKRAPKLVVDAIAEAGRLAAGAGIRLALENEPGYHAVGARSLLDIVNAVGLDSVGANWDPGNAWPYDPEIDDGPRILGDRLFNVHAKDAAERDGKRIFDALGRGAINWRAQVECLRAVGYTGPFVIETHCEPGIEKSRLSIEAARMLLA